MKPASLFMFLVGGMLFGFGLAVSRMIQPEVVLSFLLFRDFGLLLVLGGAVFVTLVTYRVIPRLLKHPVLEATAFETKWSPLNRQIAIGAAIFGIGWGLCGVCPGPAFAAVGAGIWNILLTLAGIFAGAYLHGRTARI
ncbi:MAG TPA: DUF6691 family protein [Gammaproteobacteria bacterium]|nr:DUF6691 family protein [Gammaproteobacteria bacterium]